AAVRLPDPKLKTLGKRGIECILVRYAKHSKAFKFYAIELNELVLINSIIESRDAIFDENRLSSVPRPSFEIPNGTKDFGGSVVPEDVTEGFQQPEPEHRKSKRNRTLNNFGPEFQLYLIERTRDEVYDQHSYCFNVENDPKTFDEAMKSHDVAFWKEAINDKMDSIMGNNTWVLADLPPGSGSDGPIRRIWHIEGLGWVRCIHFHGYGVFSTWMAFGGNTCDLGSFREETDKTTTLHQEPGRIIHSEPGDGVMTFMVTALEIQR
ncbi:hypothetical protein Tco_1333094, partial [Tanacetum coccineum]